MKKQLQIIACTVCMVLVGLTGYGQTFTVENITYQVIPGSSDTVAITDNTDTNREDFTVPGSVTYNGTDFSVTVIWADAFANSGLTSVIIPESVTDIGANAFTGNPDLATVVSKPTDPPSLDSSAFDDRSQIDLIVPLGTIDAYKNQFALNGWLDFRDITEEESSSPDEFEYEVVAGSNTARITGYIGMATSVDIPGTINGHTVTHIGDGVFKSKGLTSVTIPTSVTHIGDKAFQDNDFTSVTLPNNLIHIGIGAFSFSGLTGHLEIPDSVESIGEDAFNNRDPNRVNNPNPDLNTGRITSLTFTGVSKLTSIADRAFAGQNVKRLDIPDSVTSIGNGAFSDNGMNRVAIGKGVTTIGSSAFKNNGLTQVTIPNSVTELGNTVFENSGRFTIVGMEHTDSPPNIQDRSFFLGADIANPKGRKDIRLIVPRGALDLYKEPGTDIFLAAWRGFKSIEEEPTIGATFSFPDFQFDGDAITYEITSDSDRTVRVVSRDARSPIDVRIPETVFNGLPYTVTAIKENAFKDNGLTSVKLPESIIHISLGAFENNQIEEINIPGKVEFIGTRAFKNSGLTGHLEIPNSVTTVKGGVFSANQLTSVTIPSSLDTIGNGMFHTNLLTSVTIPKSVTHIENGSFVNNPSLSRIVLEQENASLLKLEQDVFLIGAPFNIQDNRGNIDVVVPRSVPPGKNKLRYSSGLLRDEGFKSITEVGDIEKTFKIEGITYKITEFNPNTVTIIDNENTGDLTIPTEVEVSEKEAGLSESDTMIEFTVAGIEAGAFENSQLTSVIIPKDVTGIGANAFAGNPDLATVELGSSDAPELGTDAFTDRDTMDVIVPNGAFDNYVPAWDDLGFRSIKAKVNIGDTFTVERDANTAVVKYQVSAFGTTNTVTVIKNEDDDRRFLEIFDFVEHVGHVFKVTKIGEDAFVGRNLVGTLIIPDGVESIGGSAFSGNSLTEVNIPNSVISIEGGAFQGNLLTSTTIPESVTGIGDDAFANNELTSVVIGQNVTRIGASVFAYNLLTSVAIPNSVTGIGAGAFRYNELTHVVIGRSVTDIGDDAFQGNLLTSVIIPENVTGIGANAFTDNPDLGTVASMVLLPPSIEASTFTNADRGQIDLIVSSSPPPGRIRANYEDAGWTGFRSIREGVGVSIEAPSETVGLSVFTVTFRFDADVTGFAIDDIDLGNAAANHFTGSGSIYTVEITPRSCDGTITIDLPANAVDMPNFTNLPASARVALEADPDSFVAIARDIAIQLDANGRATISPGDIDNGSYGCDSTPELSLDIDTFDCSNVGTPVMVTLTASQDDLTAKATAMVTVFGNCGPGSPTTGSPLVNFNRGFSPNGDGIADNLVIEGLERFRDNVVRIYDLSQRLLFKAHYGGPGDAWDGTHKGSLVPVGTYVCVIDYNEPELPHETKMIYVNY